VIVVTQHKWAFSFSGKKEMKREKNVFDRSIPMMVCMKCLRNRGHFDKLYRRLEAYQMHLQYVMSGIDHARSWVVQRTVSVNFIPYVLRISNFQIFNRMSSFPNFKICDFQTYCNFQGCLKIYLKCTHFHRPANRCFYQRRVILSEGLHLTFLLSIFMSLLAS